MQETGDRRQETGKSPVCCTFVLGDGYPIPELERSRQTPNLKEDGFSLRSCHRSSD